jgi:hypothetical protein
MNSWVLSEAELEPAVWEYSPHQNQEYVTPIPSGDAVAYFGYLLLRVCTRVWW